MKDTALNKCYSISPGSIVFIFTGFTYFPFSFRDLSRDNIEKVQNNFDVLNRDYEGDDAVRKFTHGERIAPFGESRFPEQFLP